MKRIPFKNTLDIMETTEQYKGCLLTTRKPMMVSRKVSFNILIDFGAP
jgi:hypothetical protein